MSYTSFEVRLRRPGPPIKRLKVHGSGNFAFLQLVGSQVQQVMKLTLKNRIQLEFIENIEKLLIRFT